MGLLGGAAPVRRSDVVRVFVLVVVDLFAMYEAFMLSYIQRTSTDKPLEHFVTVSGFIARILVVAPLWVLVFAVCGLYSPHLSNRRVSELTRIIVAVFGGVMTLIVWGDYLSPESRLFPSRAIPVWAVVYGVGLIILGRLLVRFLMRAFFAVGYGLHNVVLIGTGDLAQQIAHQLSISGRGYRVIAAVDPRLDGGRLGQIPVYRTLEEAVGPDARHVHEIMQAEVDLARDDIARMMRFANAHGISYRFVPDQYGVYAAASSASTVGGIPVLELRLTALDGWGAVGKRAFDLVGSALLIALFSPVLLVLAAIIKVSEPNAPVLYRQERVGKNGRPIKVMKFRSMSWRYSTGPGRPFKTQEEAFEAMGRPDLVAEFAWHHKVVDDPRVTPLGRFLRRSSLDELPQLFNALTGDLSLVGPRPITMKEIARYGEQYASFSSLKPGITGLWQVAGRSAVAYDERVKLDVFYVENWSLGLDVSILFRTMRTVAARKGAY